MKIMFQGDSVTDAGRDRSDNHLLAGYSLVVKGLLNPKYEIVNYACSGDTSDFMLWRHGYEVKKEKPDVLILLIGINDIWRKYGEMSYQAVTVEKFIWNVKKTIEITRRFSKKCKIIVLEPFVTPGSSLLYINCSNTDYKIYTNALRKEVKPLVDEYFALNTLLNNKYKKGEICLYDGVHPNDHGHAFIGEYLVKNSKILK